MSDFKTKIRERLATMSGNEEFDVLTDLVDHQLDTVAGGFVSFVSFVSFSSGPPGGPGDGGGGPQNPRDPNNEY